MRNQIHKPICDMNTLYERVSLAITDKIMRYLAQLAFGLTKRK